MRGKDRPSRNASDRVRHRQLQHFAGQPVVSEWVLSVSSYPPGAVSDALVFNMLVIANKQLCGDYGDVVAGQVFECDDATARQLLANNLVRQAAAPRIIYDTKVVTPAAAEVRPRDPFRDVFVSHA